ncbi:hypothetical protein BDV96DRAFT_601995 [Lophiotrema nucula]|uniref:Uncharacterized protein n=1 Tax=Lophiotrema nucula TaxID=690887 RepID=A0A6A5Z176_9PLEO|nr:hypothetical protein BDV96DRAFT_601995 [Lophiotrema nucula]
MQRDLGVSVIGFSPAEVVTDLILFDQPDNHASRIHSPQQTLTSSLQHTAVGMDRDSALATASSPQLADSNTSSNNNKLLATPENLSARIPEPTNTSAPRSGRPPTPSTNKFWKGSRKEVSRDYVRSDYLESLRAIKGRARTEMKPIKEEGKGGGKKMTAMQRRLMEVRKMTEGGEG